MSTQPEAMAFFDSHTFDKSYGSANEFAGDGGHIATLPEIITARSKSLESDFPWIHWFTTLSSEYFGHTKGGVPIIIVAHGVGPMASIAGTKAAYRPRKFRDDGRPDDDGEGHISLEVFRKLERGDYGDVTIVEVSRIMSLYLYPFMFSTDMSQAECDPLIQARLGPDWRAALEIMLAQSLREGVRYSGSAPKVVMNEAPAAYWLERAAKGWPFAHLLSVGNTAHFGVSHDDYIGFSVYCHLRWHSKRFIGVRPGGDVAMTHPAPRG